MVVNFFLFYANYLIAGIVTRLLQIRFVNTGFGRALAFAH